jgi:hypothetical protein
LLLLLAVLAVPLTGCHRKAPGSSASGSGQQTQPGGTETAQPLTGEVNAFMTSQLRLFLEQQGRLPTNFAELRTRLDRVPRTPANMTWAIDPVTQEVKLVKK